jgi:hypothetical protein
MAKGTSTPSRVANDVVEVAAAVASVERRSVTEQINHWARIGMQVERSTSVGGRRVLDVIAGDAQFSTLTPDERIVAHASIDAAMAERVAAARYGPSARKAGHRTVSIDDDGNLVQIDPDGTRTLL